MATTEDTVVLGSGELYAIKCGDVADRFNLTEAEIAKMVNLGYIESSAKLVAKSNAVTVTSANRGKVATFDGDKDVTFSTGIMSWRLDNVASFLTGSTYTTDATTKTDTFTYANNDHAPYVLLRFVYTNATDGKTVTIDMPKCRFSGDLSLDFNKKNAVTFDYNFDVMSYNDGSKPVYFKIKDVTAA